MAKIHMVLQGKGGARQEASRPDRDRVAGRPLGSAILAPMLHDPIVRTTGRQLLTKPAR